MGPLSAAAREAGRQAIRLAANDEVPAELRMGPPTEEELHEGRSRALMAYREAPAVGAAVGLLATTFALVKVKGAAALLMSPALPYVAAGALLVVGVKKLAENR